MNATIERMQSAINRAQREVDAEAKRIASGDGLASAGGPFIAGKLCELKEERQSNGMTPRVILAWFFTWTLCATGFVLAMTVAATLAKALKLLIP